MIPLNFQIVSYGSNHFQPWFRHYEQFASNEDAERWARRTFNPGTILDWVNVATGTCWRQVILSPRIENHHTPGNGHHATDQR